MISTSNLSIPVPPSTQGFNNNNNNSSNKLNECRYNGNVCQNSFTQSNDCKWAYNIPEVQKASSLAHVCITNKPKYCRIKTDIKAIVQNGPTCGLTGGNANKLCDF